MSTINDDGISVLSGISCSTFDANSVSVGDYNLPSGGQEKGYLTSSNECILPNIEQIRLKMSDHEGEYVILEKGGEDRRFCATKTEVNWAQTFWLVRNFDQTVSLMIRSLENGLGEFVAAQYDSYPDNSLCAIVDTTPNPQEKAAKFYINRQRNGAFSFLSLSNDKFFQGDFDGTGRLRVCANFAREWECFMVEPVISKSLGFYRLRVKMNGLENTKFYVAFEMEKEMVHQQNEEHVLKLVEEAKLANSNVSIFELFKNNDGSTVSFRSILVDKYMSVDWTDGNDRLVLSNIMTKFAWEKNFCLLPDSNKLFMLRSLYNNNFLGLISQDEKLSESGRITLNNTESGKVLKICLECVTNTI